MFVTLSASVRFAITTTPGGVVRLLNAWCEGIAGFFFRRSAIISLGELDDRALRDIGLAQLIERDATVTPPRDRLLESSGRTRDLGQTQIRWQRRRGAQCSERTEHLSSTDGAHQTSPRFMAATACAAARAVIAMYVMLGFWHAQLAMHEPSVRKRFFTSHA